MKTTRFSGYALSLAACVLPLVAAMPAQSKAPQASPAQPAQKAQAAATPPAQSHNDGERIFAQNCSRCHNTPEGFPPSISATVVRHMRVRAQLSEHDEQELLRFFNP